MPPDNVSGLSGGEIWGSLLTVFLVLILIIALIFILVRFLAYRQRHGAQSNKAIRMLGGVVLGQNKSMQLVEIAGCIYIIGVADEIRLIDKIDDPDRVGEMIALMESVYSPRTMPFLAEWFKRRSARSHADQERELDEQDMESRGFQEIFQEKIMHASSRRQRVQQMLEDEMRHDRSEKS